MEVWSSRRGGISYENTGHENEDGQDDESIGSQSKKRRCCTNCICKCFHSMALSNEDELIFIHSSWELLEKGSGKLSAALDYLVYRCFYALALIGLIIYAGVSQSESLTRFPVIHFINAGLHIFYSIIYTLHIVTGKTHRAKVGKIDDDVENSANEVKTPLKFGSNEHLATLDIQEIVKTKPHPIQIPDKIIWLIFNIYASFCLATAIVHYADLDDRHVEEVPTNSITNKETTFDELYVVFVGYQSFATCVELVANCIPLRVIHFIYPLLAIWNYALFSVSLELLGFSTQFEYDKWIDNVATTGTFYLKGSALTIFVHIILCGIAYIRNQIIYIFSKPSERQSHLGQNLEAQLNNMIENDTDVKEFVNRSTFHEDYEEEERIELKKKLDKERKEQRIKDKSSIMVQLGAKAFLKSLKRKKSEGSSVDTMITNLTSSQTGSMANTSVSKDNNSEIQQNTKIFKPYNSQMTIDEYLESLTLDDRIARVPKANIENENDPNFSWVDEKRKKIEKLPISGIKKKIKPKKWNEFYTPPDSLIEITLKSRHKERGVNRNFEKLEAYNEKLVNVSQIHHVLPGTFTGPKVSETMTGKNKKDTMTGLNKNTETIKEYLRKTKGSIPNTKIVGPRPTTLENKQIVNIEGTKTSVNVAGENNIKGISQPKTSIAPQKSIKKPKEKFSYTGIKVHDNWVPYVPLKAYVAPKLKWYLGDTSLLPRPPTPPQLKPSSPILSSLEKRKKLLENEKAELIQSLKIKLNPKSEQFREKLRRGIRESIRVDTTPVHRRPSTNNKLVKELEIPVVEIPKPSIVEPDTINTGKKGKTQYIVSDFIKNRTEKQKIKDDKIHLRLEHARRPHFIVLNIKKKVKVRNEETEKFKKRLKEQERRTSRLTYELMKKPRQEINFDHLSNHPENPGHPENQLLSLLLHFSSEQQHEDDNDKTNIQGLQKQQDQGILKSGPIISDLATSTTPQQKKSTTLGKVIVPHVLKKRSLRSNLQLKARVHALGPMPNSIYHPLKNSEKKKSTQDILTYHFLDDKLPHTGGNRKIEQNDLKHYMDHPGTHIHHPVLNLQHKDGPHESVHTAIKEHVSSKLKKLNEQRHTHPALIRKSSAEVKLKIESPKKDDESIENALRVIAFHPIVQFRAVDITGEVKKRDSGKTVTPFPKMKEYYPREELKKIGKVSF